MPKSKKDRPIRILSVSDLHCGNISGLTPDKYNPQTELNYKAYVYRRSLWEWFTAEVEKLKPIDICVCNGDLIDGKGPKTGGAEQIYSQRPVQIQMAVDVLKTVEAQEYHFSYGTGYHTGPEDDWELQIAQSFGAGVDDVCTLEPRGLVMKWRHHIGGSQVPTGKATPMLRQQENDILWAASGEYLRADVMIFSHVHYYQAYDNRYGMVITTPGLQGMGGSQLGARRLGGPVDYGFIHFDIKSRLEWTWTKHLLKQTRAVRAGQLATAPA